MEKLIGYSKVFLFYASGLICLYLFGDIIGLAVFGCIISMGIVHYFCISEDKRFPFVRSVFCFYSLSLIIANLAYLPFENGIFDYKDFYNRLCSSLWLTLPFVLLDIITKKNWK